MKSGPRATEGNVGSNSQRKAAEAKSVNDDGIVDVIDDGYHDDDDSDEDSDASDDSDDSDESNDIDDIDDSNDSDEECEVHDSEDKVKERDTGNVSSMAGSTTNKPESSLSGNLEDTLLNRIMKEANVDCFPTVEDATPIIEAYEVQSGNSLAIKQSLYDKFWLFRCCEHIDCPFQILLSKRRSDRMFCVLRMKHRHTALRRLPRAADGRSWKRHRH